MEGVHNSKSSLGSGVHVHEFDLITDLDACQHESRPTCRYTEPRGHDSFRHNLPLTHCCTLGLTEWSASEVQLNRNRSTMKVVNNERKWARGGTPS